jgi:hypothetical protein
MAKKMQRTFAKPENQVKRLMQRDLVIQKAI